MGGALDGIGNLTAEAEFNFAFDPEAAEIVLRDWNRLVLVDWSITKEANELYNKGYAVVAYPGVAKPVEHFPANLLEKMIDNDFEFAANNRKAILEEWQKRYDAKTEPKG